MPIARIMPSTFFSDSGSGILTLALLKKPFSAPSLPIAAADPSLSAALSPATASLLLMSAIPAARAGPANKSAISGSKRGFKNRRMNDVPKIVVLNRAGQMGLFVGVIARTHHGRAGGV